MSRQDNRYAQSVCRFSDRTYLGRLLCTDTISDSICNLITNHFFSADIKNPYNLGNFAVMFDNFTHKCNISFLSLKSEIREFLSSVDVDSRCKPYVTRKSYDAYGIASIIASESVDPIMYEDQEFLDTLILTDHVALYPYTLAMLNKVFERVKYLRTDNVELYIIHTQEYNKYITNVLRHSKESYLPYETYQEIIKIFPDITANQKKLGYEEPQKSYNFEDYPVDVCAYSLGLPIQKYSFTREILNRCYEEYKADPEAYIKKMETINDDNLKNMVADYKEITSVDVEVVNTEDSLMEDVWSYSQFDIYRIVENGKIFQFTRVELPSIMKKMQNFWTRSPLRTIDIEQISTMSIISQSMIPCLPLRELLEDISNPTRECILEEVIRREMNLPTVRVDIRVGNEQFNADQSDDEMERDDEDDEEMEDSLPRPINIEMPSFSLVTSDMLNRTRPLSPENDYEDDDEDDQEISYDDDEYLQHLI